MKGKGQWKLAVILLFVIVCGAFYLRVQDSGGKVELLPEGQPVLEKKKEPDTQEEFSEASPLPEQPSDGEKASQSEIQTSQKEPFEEPDEWVVHICGEVMQEGVYRLPAGARVVDAIQAAGGLTEEAEGAWLNQAGLLEDGMQIYIPSKTQVKEWEASGKLEAGELKTGISSDSPEAAPNGKINLNQAGREELMSLPGIGESKAEAILSYREENGSFESIEELMKVPGIKEGVFRSIEERITTGK